MPLQILVVEDDADCAESTAMLLRLYGHSAEVAKDGPAALNAAEAHWPEVVLLDIAMPRMSGWEVAKRFREQAGKPRPVLIAATGYGAGEDRRHSADLGIDFHLTKPVDPEALNTLLLGLRREAELENAGRN